MERRFGLEPIPCPTCWGAADLHQPENPGDFPQSHCCAGHINSLIPDVLKTLRMAQAKAEAAIERDTA